MTVRKVSLSLDEAAASFADAAAKRAGMSLSAWASGALRRAAVSEGAGEAWGDAEAEALADAADEQIAGEQQGYRAAG